MIASKGYQITLAYQEIAALCKYLYDAGKSMEWFADSAAYHAGPHGVTVICCTKEQSEAVWDAVIEATEEEE